MSRRATEAAGCMGTSTAARERERERERETESAIRLWHSLADQRERERDFTGTAR